MTLLVRIDGQNHMCETMAEVVTLLASVTKFTSIEIVHRNGRATCGHNEYQDGHCAYMSCDNYINKHRFV